jgi:pseudo-response regulator 5
MKGRPRNFDLILTEVDLPSISGYALLTLIMEHDICKNIPVISMILNINLLICLQISHSIDKSSNLCTFFMLSSVMSSQDSVSTVYKCMCRGAADYLVKPIRINELRNLWQHVWRRQSVGFLISHFSFPFWFFS